MIQLRPFQKKAISDIERFIKSDHFSGIVVMPTGAGKSFVITEAINNFDNVLILQPDATILKQNYTKYIDYGFTASIFSASVGEKVISKVTFATAKSIDNYIGKLNFDAVFVDECHLATQKGMVIDNIIKKVKAKKVIGLTATPILSKYTPLGNVPMFLASKYAGTIFDDVIHVTNISEVLEYWTEIKYLKSGVNTGMLQMAVTDFSDKSLSDYFIYNEIHLKIEKSINYLKDLKIDQAIIFVPSIKECEFLCEFLTNKRVSIKAAHSKFTNTQNQQTVSDFHTRKVKFLVTIRKFGIGYDNPNLMAIIDASPTNSLQLYYQRVGRLVRLLRGVDLKYYLDLAGNTERFGKVNGITINYNSIHTEKGKHTKYFDYKEYHKPDDTIIPCLKHKGKTVGFILKTDASYIRWIAETFTPENEVQLLFKNYAKEVVNRIIK